MTTMKIFTMGLLILLKSTLGLAQENTEKKLTHRKQKEKLAEQYINKLHDGVLLVRLQTKKKSIEGLREMGKMDFADRIEIRQAGLNKEIIYAFQANFDFCPTYFFYSDDSKAVKEKDFDRVEFLNEKLKVDTTISFEGQNFLTAEFGKVKQASGQYFDGYAYESGEDGIEERKKYYGSANMGFDALIIKSDQFVQLSNPFPYYYRTLESLPILNRRPGKVVKRMNAQLHQFYKERKR